MKNQLLAGLLLLGSHWALAFDEAVYQEVYKDLQSQTKTLSRSLMVYHRFHNEGLKQLAPTDTYWNKSVLQYRAPYYFEPQTSNDLFGPGVYAAVDPTSSYTFGKLMIQIEVAPGTVFLDTRNGLGESEDGIKFRKTTYQSLVNMCGPIKLLNGRKYFRDGVEWVSVKKSDVYVPTNCRVLMNQAFRDLKIQFLVYDWNSDTGTSDRIYEPCKAKSTIAFVVMGALVNDQRNQEDTKTIDFSAFKVTGYSPNYVFKDNFSYDPSLRKAEKLAAIADPMSEMGLYYYINELNRISDSTKNMGHDAWSIFDELIEATPRTEVTEKIKSTRFKCDQSVYVEDKSTVFDKTAKKIIK